MCGLLGRIRSHADANPLEAALPWLSRRGPDSQRLWRSADGRVELLFARLAIVDRDSRANQPLTDAAAGVTLAMNGEIYNYGECRAELSGYRFKTESDTEAALAAYVTHGIEGLRALKGMYAMAIVDERRRRVVIARDAVGKKPLFVATWHGDTLFGSSLLALVAAHGARPDVDTSVSQYGYWEEAFVPPAQAALEGALPVLPGQVMEFDWSGSMVRTDRCEPDAALTYSGEPLDEVKANVGALVRVAVGRRLESNPNPITLLSGGIDSTVVAAAASTLVGSGDDRRQLRALTLGAVVPGTNDESYARYAGRRLGVPLTVMRPRHGALSEAVAHALDLQDEPLGMPSFFLLERLVSTAAQHGRILLSGDGGDEVFLGYRPPKDWRGSSDDSDAASHARVGGGLPSWMGQWGRKVATVTLLGHMMAKADRASAEQGVELRCPLLDWDVIRYARSLPFEMLAGQGQSKALLKVQLAGWPAWFLERPKRGFTYNLRWVWGVRRYSGLREMIDPRAVDTFAHLLPPGFSADARRWKTSLIFREFSSAWKLLAWSRFLQRLDKSASQPRTASPAVVPAVAAAR